MRSSSTSTRRVWLSVNVLVTLALLPALFTEPEAEPVVVAAAGPVETVPVAASRSERAASSTTTPAPPAPTTTAAPRPASVAPEPTRALTSAPKAAPAPKAATTTTTAPQAKPAPTTTTTAPPAPASGGTESGKASWYDHEPGICAHKTLPMGTVVTVAARGRSTTCTVGDRGPFVEGWIIDLHPEQFEQLAPRSTGVISVTISW